MKSRKLRTHENPPACRRPGEETEPPARRPGTILVVDADPAIRGLIASSLRHLGHRVTEASDSAGALQLAAGGETFDLLVTDIHLRSTGAISMARTLLDMSATSAVLFMSESVALARALTRSIGTGMFLAKPFTAEEFKHHIDECLRRSYKFQSHSQPRNAWARQRLRGIGSRPNRRFWRSSDRQIHPFGPAKDDNSPTSIN